jgi:WS/DGAT/MGAT family acyltransferase
MQVPGTDAIFLAIETEEVYGHTGGLLILDPTGSEGWGFERVQRMMRERIPLAPKFTWALKEVPLGIDRPYWVPVPNFDPAEHLHRIAVPAPGGMREVAELCGYLFSRRLDRRRPLWEMWFIDGLAGGRAALFTKLHHCMCDGVSGSDLGTLLCDLEPNPSPRAPTVAAKTNGPVPGDVEILLKGLLNFSATPLNVITYAGQALRRGISMLSFAGRNGAPPRPDQVPKVSFNAAIGSRRGFACASVPFEDLRALKNELGVKINDVVLELCGAAIRCYLRQRGETVRGSLVLTCAVSTREAGDRQLGNQVATMNVACASHLSDPVRRVKQIHRNAEVAKEFTRAVRSTPIRAIGETLPPVLLNLVFRSMTAASDLTPVMSNAVVSNVTGPPVPLYAAGARIEGLYPMSILATGQGLNFTVISNMDRMDFGLTVDPDLVPDAWQLAEQIPVALAELQRAVERRRAPKLRRALVTRTAHVRRVRGKAARVRPAGETAVTAGAA